MSVCSNAVCNDHEDDAMTSFVPRLQEKKKIKKRKKPKLDKCVAAMF